MEENPTVFFHYHRNAQANCEGLKRVGGNARVWIYADLSSKAKAAGGPDQLIDSIYNEGYADGSYVSIAIKAACAFGGGLVVAAGVWIKSKWDEHRRIKKEGEAARQRLLEELNRQNALSNPDIDQPTEG